MNFKLVPQLLAGLLGDFSARQSLRTADSRQRIAELLRGEDALAGLLHGRRHLLPVGLRRRLPESALLGRDLLERGLFSTCSSTAGCANCSEIARGHAQNYSPMRTRSHIEKRHRLAQRRNATARLRSSTRPTEEETQQPCEEQLFELCVVWLPREVDVPS